MLRFEGGAHDANQVALKNTDEKFMELPGIGFSKQELQSCL